MEQRISLITLGVTDLIRSREFYERLGWRRSMAKTEGIAFFQAGGMALALYPRHELAKDANIAPEGNGFSGVTLAYNTGNRSEVDSVLKEAQAAGARIQKPAQEAFWGGYSGYFSDPDGFLWEVAWNPGFAIAADGSIQMTQSLIGSMTQFFYATAPAARAAPSATIFPCPCPSELASACSARLITSVTISTGS
jgi:predicted lactoylglutathione lyase